jgi:hypothetical protein
MSESIFKRLVHGWNAFKNKEPTRNDPYGYKDYTYFGHSTSRRPDRVTMTRTNERSIIVSVYNRIALDVAAMEFGHVRVDEENSKFKENIKSFFNDCLTIAPNIDQTPMPFIQSLVLQLFDEGCVAVVPVDTDLNPEVTSGYDIKSMRVGKIVEWFPSKVRVELYNDQTGLHEDVIVDKANTAIIENPFYAVMNEPNSTLSRLKTKLILLDAIDNQSGSGRLDIIIQLPYVVKGQKKQEQAETRIKDIEMQMTDSKYGIGYIDGTEKITQLNRPVENNLMKQVEYLTSMLYSQLSITDAILDGSADDKTMVNYLTRTVEPIVRVILEQFRAKFLTKTARSQHQDVMAFRDIFKRIPVTELADIADKLTRNEILSPNEVRAAIGFKPAKDPKADELRNRNLNESKYNASGDGAEEGDLDED